LPAKHFLQENQAPALADLIARQARGEHHRTQRPASDPRRLAAECESVASLAFGMNAASVLGAHPDSSAARAPSTGHRVFEGFTGHQIVELTSALVLPAGLGPAAISASGLLEDRL